MARKIIQIEVGVKPEGRRPASACIIGLCDDGTIWAFPFNADGRWTAIPEIPQGPAEEKSD